MVKRKNPREIREKIIQRDYEFYKSMNFGSKNNIDREENVAMGFSNSDIILNINPNQNQSTADDELDIEHSFIIEIPIIQSGTYSWNNPPIKLRIED